MATTEIGALIIALRTESTQFRAEMDKARSGLRATQGSFQATGHAAGNATFQLSRFAAIGVQQVIPAADGIRVALEQVFMRMFRSVNLQSTQGFGIFEAFSLRITSVTQLLTQLGVVAAAGGLGFALGNIAQNFREGQAAGLGYVESLKLAVGLTKSYSESVK